ncbi:MAG TPA: zinc ribbon domain-containing protein [Fibrobacteria bacterium]|nr:zinc ribbon domain-containing protein [Fibrobacteria bacterium]HOX53635.1 zinc ribbon domain-containing protein [Fibrobacteria bacterium]
MSRPGEDFVCPNCGEELPAGSKFCPECGSDDKTGWSEETYLDGVSLPDDDPDDPQLDPDPEAPPRMRWGLALVAAGILLASLLIYWAAWR